MTLSPGKIRCFIFVLFFAGLAIGTNGQPGPSGRVPASDQQDKTDTDKKPGDKRIIARPRHTDRPNETEPRVIAPIPVLPPSNIPQTQQGGAPNDRQPQHGGAPDDRPPQAGGTNRRTTDSVGHSPVSRPDGYAPAQPIADVLTRKIGSEKFQQLLDTIAAGGDPGMGSSNADVRFEGARRRVGIDAVVPAGTQFFSQPRMASQLKATSPADADKAVDKWGGIPGGVVLEGVATSLGRIDDFEYDAHVNAFIINGGAVYFARVPPKIIVTLCHGISRDEKERIGVSLGEKEIVYGEVPANSDLAWDLKMADAFLGDIVFASGDKTEGYNFANDYKPQQAAELGYSVAVFFTFDGFEFQAKDEQIEASAEGLDIRLLPLTEAKAADGGHLPDKQALAEGKMAKEFKANAEHLANNISHYRRERIIQRMFDYGEVAAIFRQLKHNDFDLDELANRIEASTK